MSTVAPKKPVRVRAARASKAPAVLRRLTPPPGPSARDALSDYPVPSSEFNVAAVESLVAARSRR